MLNLNENVPRKPTNGKFILLVDSPLLPEDTKNGNLISTAWLRFFHWEGNADVFEDVIMPFQIIRIVWRPPSGANSAGTAGKLLDIRRGLQGTECKIHRKTETVVFLFLKKNGYCPLE